MNKVLFDHQIFTEQNHGGISRYFKYVINGIRETNDFSYQLGALRSNNYYIRDEKLLLRRKIFKSLFNTQDKIVKRNNDFTNFLIRRGEFDVFHATYYNPVFLEKLNKPLVVTVHDMTYERFPHLFSPHDPIPYHKRILVERADKVIAISENTKNDILKYYSIDENKISVIHHGISSQSPIYQEVEFLPQNYILFVGTRVSYKNFYLLAEAFRALSENDDDLYLVLAGQGLGLAEIEFLRRIGVIKKTIQVSATDEQLNTLYKFAKCFVYPSMYEGFGLPILEAFKNNCPVLLSNSSCFPEIAGDAAHYFESGNVDSLEEKIRLIVYQQNIRTELIESGKSKLLNYSIKKCINETINLYKSLC